MKSFTANNSIVYPVKIILVLCAGLLLTVSAQAQQVSLNQPAAFDVSPPALATAGAVKNVRPDAGNGPAAYNYQLDAETALVAPRPHVQESRSFTQQVTAAQIKAGVPLLLSSGPAIVRLSPIAGNKSAVLIPSVRIVTESGAEMDLSELAENLADAEALKAAGADFGQGTVAFKLPPHSGAVAVRMEQPGGSYLLHVFEPDSPVVLTLRAGSDVAFAGQTVTFSGVLTGADGVQAQAFVSAPGGATFDAVVSQASDGRISGLASLPSSLAGEPGLWEVHLFSRGQGSEGAVAREARTAFDVVVPTAKFAGQATFQVNPHEITVTLPIQAAAPGRYQAEAALQINGKPAAFAEFAQQIEPGVGKLKLTFDGVQTKVGDKLELTSLQLKDQDRLSVLERRFDAISFMVAAPLPSGTGTR